jgi:hypothetical protein
VIPVVRAADRRVQRLELTEADVKAQQPIVDAVLDFNGKLSARA